MAEERGKAIISGECPDVRILRGQQCRDVTRCQGVWLEEVRYPEGCIGFCAFFDVYVFPRVLPDDWRVPYQDIGRRWELAVESLRTDGG